MDHDLRSVPFSRSGSWLCFREQDAQEGLPGGLWLRSVHGDSAAGRELLHLEPLRDGAPVAFRVEVDPAELRLVTDAGMVRLCFATPGSLLLRGEGIGLRVTARPHHDHFAVAEGGHWRISSIAAFLDLLLAMRSGTAVVDSPWSGVRCQHVRIDLTADGGTAWEAQLDEDVGAARPAELPAYPVALAEVRRTWEAFRDGCLAGVHPAWRATAERAAWLLWATTVDPCGHIRRPAVLMSKNRMCNVWSWDHAFNALGLVKGHPDVALDQFLLPFDHQFADGRLPDYINDARRLPCFVKPPVHGLIWSMMLAERPDVLGTRQRLEEVYAPLARWSRWWLQRDHGAGLPVYHHGFDSGWDNATVFDVGMPVHSPELAAYLAIQLDTVAMIADRLGLAAEAAGWRTEAETLRGRLLARLWRDGRFIVPRADTGACAAGNGCLLPLMPLVLGRQLSAAVRDALVAGIRGHLTPWGLATERTDSPLYLPDGYWRGPVWAPPTLLLADALDRSGVPDLAAEVARRFCRLCARSGFAECFDAVTGGPRNDRAYSWTAGVFLTLARRWDEG